MVSCSLDDTLKSRFIQHRAVFVLRYLYMNNKIIVGIIAVAVVLGGVWYSFSNSTGGNGGWVSTATTTLPVSTSTQQTTTKKSSTSNTAGSGAVKKSVTPVKIAGVGPLSYLFDLKQPLVCSVKTTIYVKRSGTMYVADRKMRGNFTSYINGMLTNTSMIDDGAYLYVWKNGASTGLKLLATISVSGSVIASNGGFDPSTDLSFACNTWTKNENVFVPPTSVSFSNTP